MYFYFFNSDSSLLSKNKNEIMADDELKLTLSDEDSPLSEEEEVAGGGTEMKEEEKEEKKKPIFGAIDYRLKEGNPSSLSHRSQSIPARGRLSPRGFSAPNRRQFSYPRTPYDGRQTPSSPRMRSVVKSIPPPPPPPPHSIPEGSYDYADGDIGLMSGLLLAPTCPKICKRFALKWEKEFPEKYWKYFQFKHDRSCPPYFKKCRKEIHRVFMRAGFEKQRTARITGEDPNDMTIESNRLPRPPPTPLLDTPQRPRTQHPQPQRLEQQHPQQQRLQLTQPQPPCSARPSPSASRAYSAERPRPPAHPIAVAPLASNPSVRSKKTIGEGQPAVKGSSKNPAAEGQPGSRPSAPIGEGKPTNPRISLGRGAMIGAVQDAIIPGHRVRPPVSVGRGIRIGESSSSFSHALRAISPPSQQDIAASSRSGTVSTQKVSIKLRKLKRIVEHKERKNREDKRLIIQLESRNSVTLSTQQLRSPMANLYEFNDKDPLYLMSDSHLPAPSFVPRTDDDDDDVHRFTRRVVERSRSLSPTALELPFAESIIGTNATDAALDRPREVHRGGKGVKVVKGRNRKEKQD